MKDGKLVALGFLNDSRAADSALSGAGKIRRRCRWCKSALTRTVNGAILCTGLCDAPDPGEYSGPALVGYQA